MIITKIFFSYQSDSNIPGILDLLLLSKIHKITLIKLFLIICFEGETLEETARREVAEEVGLEVDSLQYSGSQHWPFPNSSLMIACQATVKDDKVSKAFLTSLHLLEISKFLNI